MAKITKKMNILEIVQKYPETIPVFGKHGFHCLGCVAAQFEDLEQGATAHGIDVEKLVKEMNEVIESSKSRVPSSGSKKKEDKK